MILVSEKFRDLNLYLNKSEVYEELIIGGENRYEVITRRQTKYYRVKDRVEHIYNILERLIDYQTDAQRRSGIQINPRPRRYLKGWDFRDMVTDDDSFSPRVATLQAMGKGWVDFARAIHAVALLGRGFDQLIKPKPGMTSTAKPCPKWFRIPSGRYYLTARITENKEIMEENGDMMCNPRNLCDRVLWHMIQNTFQPCHCTNGRTAEHGDPVQVLFPLNFKSRFAAKPLVPRMDAGAVVFGHSINLHWHYKDVGDPVKGNPPRPEGEEQQRGEYDPGDSGIRSSVGSPADRISSASDSVASRK